MFKVQCNTKDLGNDFICIYIYTCIYIYIIVYIYIHSITFTRFPINIILNQITLKHSKSSILFESHIRCQPYQPSNINQLSPRIAGPASGIVEALAAWSFYLRSSHLTALARRRQEMLKAEMQRGFWNLRTVKSWC